MWAHLDQPEAPARDEYSLAGASGWLDFLWRFGSPPQTHRGASRKTVHGQLPLMKPNLQRVRQPPTRIVGVAAGAQEMNALVGRADPAAVGFGLVAEIRTVHENVG